MLASTLLQRETLENSDIDKIIGDINTIFPENQKAA
jgi:hypothetical protein